MLLRSSSTPLLGSFSSESPSNSHLHHEIKHHIVLPTTVSQSHNRSPFYQNGSLNLITASCGSSPSIADLDHRHSHKGIRRAQSEGNLEGLGMGLELAYEEFYNSNQTKKLSGRAKRLMLETIPSFSFYNPRGGCENVEEEEEEEHWDTEDGEELLMRNTRGGERVVMAMYDGDGEFSLRDTKGNVAALTGEFRVTDQICNNVDFRKETRPLGQDVYLGIDGSSGGENGSGCGGGGGSSGGDCNPAGGDGGDMHGVEEYYRRMVEESPGDPLFLRNYAEFLYKSKKDLRGAEEYYSRAILADPKDGEILSQYAKLIWELHRDQDRALSYFDRAAQASPDDSHVHAAYASFLWETEEDENECDAAAELEARPQNFHQGATMASASA